MQHRLKPFPRTAGARVVAPELLEQFDLAIADGAPIILRAAFDARLRRKSLTPFARPLESRGCRRIRYDLA